MTTATATTPEIEAADMQLHSSYQELNAITLPEFGHRQMRMFQFAPHDPSRPKASATTATSSTTCASRPARVPTKHT